MSKEITFKKEYARIERLGEIAFTGWEIAHWDGVNIRRKKRPPPYKFWSNGTWSYYVYAELPENLPDNHAGSANPQEAYGRGTIISVTEEGFKIAAREYRGWIAKSDKVFKTLDDAIVAFLVLSGAVEIE